jgi:hypothetical protein
VCYAARERSLHGCRLMLGLCACLQHTDMHTYRHAHIHTRTCTHRHLYTRHIATHTHTYACTHTYAPAHTHTYIHLHTRHIVTHTVRNHKCHGYTLAQGNKTREHLLRDYRLMLGLPADPASQEPSPSPPTDAHQVCVHACVCVCKGCL